MREHRTVIMQRHAAFIHLSLSPDDAEDLKTMTELTHDVKKQGLVQVSRWSFVPVVLKITKV